MKTRRLVWVVTVLILLSICFLVGCAVEKQEVLMDSVEVIDTSINSDTDDESNEIKNIAEQIDDLISAENNNGSMSTTVKNEKNTNYDNQDLDYSKDKQVDGSFTINLLVTEDYGSKVIFSGNIALSKKVNVIQALQSKLDVKTSWDGSFIQGINGLDSAKQTAGGYRKDWFYYVNGVCSAKGAADYSLIPGDKVWWDYHAWSMGLINNAVIGAYPEPFIKGYEGATVGVNIMALNKYQTQAIEIKNFLQKNGATQVKVMNINEQLLVNRPTATIIIGEWSELAKSDWLKNFNQAYRKNSTGIYFDLDKGSLKLVNMQGKTSQEFNAETGVVVATASNLGDSKPLWLVTGIDEQGVKQALDIIIQQPEKLRGKYGLLVQSGQETPLPVKGL